MNAIAPALILVLWLTGSCKDKQPAITVAKNVTVPAPVLSVYDLTKPEKRELHKRLKEISGINYIGNEKLVAEEDEDGIIYLVDFNSGKIETSFNFGPPGDYEDIVTLQNFYYLLRSDGTIFKVNRSNPNAATTKTFSFGKTNMEFETLYADAGNKRLIMICKNCAGNDHNSIIDAYSFDLATEKFNPNPVYTIDEAAARKLLHQKKGKLKPSAAAIHPIEKKLYVLCSVGKVLLVCSLTGNIEKVYPLDSTIFIQPEGIAFAPSGDMYISNEGQAGKANILKFNYTPLH